MKPAADLTAYRRSPAERQRTEDLLRLVPASGHSALDIGARDGHFSLLMADRFDAVTALDLEEPRISHPKIRCVRGDAADLPFDDGSFDFVFCAEVLEHVPAAALPGVCREIERVASQRILIGVPYQQDIRVGRTTCRCCGRPNPPWGHVSTFDEQRIAGLFGRSQVESISFAGVSSARTNRWSAALMDFAGNPYGTYDQEEACIHCGQPLTGPPPRTPLRRAASKCAFWLRQPTQLLARPHGDWMHVVLRRAGAA